MGEHYNPQPTGSGRRWRLGVTMADGTRRWVRGTSKADVRAKARELHGHAAAGTTPPARNLKLRTIAEHWRDQRLPRLDLAPSTREQYRWAADLIVERVGGRRVVDFKPGKIENWLADLGAEYARSSVRIVRLVLRQIYAQAVRDDQVGRNYAAESVLPTNGAAPAERAAFSAADTQALLAAAAGTPFEALWTTAITTGARRGELCALAWSDVDLDAGTMTIRRGHRRAENGAWEIGTTKTDNSRRTVPLTASTVRALRAHKIASPYSGQRDLVFPNSVGRPLDPGRYRRAWADVCTAAGFVDDDGRPTRVPHELRHSVGSHGIDAGATVAQVADQLGNTPETVWRYYRHRTADVVDAGVADVMENLVTRKVSR